MNGASSPAAEVDEVIRKLSRPQIAALDDAFVGSQGWRVRGSVYGLTGKGLVREGTSLLTDLGQDVRRRLLVLGENGVKALKS